VLTWFEMVPTGIFKLLFRHQMSLVSILIYSILQEDTKTIIGSTLISSNGFIHTYTRTQNYNLTCTHWYYRPVVIVYSRSVIATEDKPVVMCRYMHNFMSHGYLQYQ